MEDKEFTRLNNKALYTSIFIIVLGLSLNYFINSYFSIGAMIAGLLYFIFNKNELLKQKQLQPVTTNTGSEPQ